jgi:multidrug resistance protein MdtO
MNGSVPYEFGGNREQHVRTGDMILRASLTTASLFWNQLALSHSEGISDYIADPDLREMRRRVAVNMNAMAEIITQRSAVQVENVDAFISPALLAHTRYGEYAQNTAIRYEELRTLTAMLRMPVRLREQVAVYAGN